MLMCVIIEFPTCLGGRCLAISLPHLDEVVVNVTIYNMTVYFLNYRHNSGPPLEEAMMSASKRKSLDLHL